MARRVQRGLSAGNHPILGLFIRERFVVNSAPMKVTSIWDLLTKFVLFLLFVAAGVGIFFWYLPLIQQNQRMRKDIAVLETEIRAEEKIRKSLRAQTEAVMNDPRTVERLARERLVYARTNETIFVFDAPKQSRY